ncbi:MAG: superoxide dismutase [Muribaculaceae bacterium]|nr:superoxide dismutase [Muribaculaceae bacterium]
MNYYPREGKFTLIDLPYAATALQPVISAETLSFHHGKHLQAYVNNLNAAVAHTEFEGMSLQEIVLQATTSAILNNAGQLLNHNLYFTQFCAPATENAPSGRLLEAIERDFGSFEAFKEEFQQKGATLFGSGWVWLAAKDGKLVITQEANAANPIQRGMLPLLTFDVWEHAYYLEYQNRRPDHLAALWQIVDWNVIADRYLQQ